jgi:hypothetical protein
MTNLTANWSKSLKFDHSGVFMVHFIDLLERQQTSDLMSVDKSYITIRIESQWKFLEGRERSGKSTYDQERGLASANKRIHWPIMKNP